MNGILISLVVVFGIIAIAVLILIWKIVSFKSKIEDTVVDSIKEVIVTKGPEAVKYVNDKISKPKPPKSQVIKEGSDPVEMSIPQPTKPPKSRKLKEGKEPPKPEERGSQSVHEREGLHDGVEVRDHHRRPQSPKPPKDRILKEGQQPPKPDNL